MGPDWWEDVTPWQSRRGVYYKEVTRWSDSDGFGGHL